MTLKQLLSTISWHCVRHRRHRREVLDAALQVWLRSGVDRVCVTGDLVNFALPAEYCGAADVLDRLSRVAPVSLVPGNHDALAASGMAELRRHWARWLDGEENSADGLLVHFHGPVAIVGLSSAIPTPPLLAYGAVQPQQLSALERLLPKLRQSGHFRVVMLHHPPQAGVMGWRCGLHQAAALRGILQRTGAELVLHGHLHRPVRAWLAGPDAPIPVFGAGSSSLLARRGGSGRRGHFHLFALEGSPGGWRLEVTDYFHDTSDGVFHPEASETVPGPACFRSH